MKVWHENKGKYTEGKREARNVGMTGKSGKREILWKKNTEEEGMRRKEYIYMPCQAIPLTHSQ